MQFRSSGILFSRVHLKSREEAHHEGNWVSRHAEEVKSSSICVVTCFRIFALFKIFKRTRAAGPMVVWELSTP